MGSQRVERIVKNLLSFLQTHTTFVENWNNYKRNEQEVIRREMEKIVEKAVSPKKVHWRDTLTELCKDHGYEDVMTMVSTLWREKGVGWWRVLGPAMDAVVPCGCGDDVECPWCAGVRFVAPLVKRVKEEEEAKGDTTDTDEMYDPILNESRIQHLTQLKAIGCRSAELTLPDIGTLKVDFVVQLDGQTDRVCQNCGARIPFGKMADAVEDVACPNCGHVNVLGESPPADNRSAGAMQGPDSGPSCPKCGARSEQITTYSVTDAPTGNKLRWRCWNLECCHVWDE